MSFVSLKSNSLTSASIYAASEYAAALAPFYSKRSIQTAFARIAPTGKKLMGGNLADAWAVTIAPSKIRTELEKRARQHLVRSVEAWLEDPRCPWQPAIPLARLSEKTVAEATKLCAALREALALPLTASMSARVETALVGFKREFGYDVTPRHLRRLIERTMERDAGLEGWSRLEIYLPDNLKAKAAGPTLVRSVEFPELEDAFSSVEDRNNATTGEIAYCWRMIVECLDSRVASGETQKRVKKNICDYVVRAAPFLAETPAAFRRNLNRKLAIAATDGVNAIDDKRSMKSGNRRGAPEEKENLALLARWTRVRGGRESQAWRELYTGQGSQGQQFTEAFRAYYQFDGRVAKSRVPGSVRAAISPIIKATNAIHLGPKAAKIALPSIHRDWSDTDAGDIYISDDVTINHYWWEAHEFGKYEFQGMRFNVVRGQWLPICDERTDNPLSFLLMPDRNYNSRVIRTLNTRTFCDPTIGLPFKGMKYEQGIWKARNIAAQFSWTKIDESFARLGISLRLRHARGPKAKVIERVIGTAQNMMEHLPGYVGRDEMHVRYERVQKFLLSLKAVGQPVKGEVDPREMFLSKEEMADELVKVMRDFANEPQNGERLQGLSPAEAWKQLAPNKPHTVLPESLRYLLSTHQSSQTVTSEGVKLKIGNIYQYYVAHEKLGALQGEKVHVYYDEDQPEQVIVIHPASDPKGVNPFAVPLFQRLPANTATAADFAAAKAAQRTFSSFGKATYRLIAPASNLTLQNTALGSPELRERGDKIAGLQREKITIENSRQRHRGEIKSLAARGGLSIDPATAKNPARVVEHLERASELEAEILKLEQGDKRDV